MEAAASRALTRTDQRYRRLRRFTQWYPFRNGAAFFCRLLGRLGTNRHGKRLAFCEGYLDQPRMAVDLSVLYHRKLYLFPRAYVAKKVRREFGAYLATRPIGPGDVFLDVGANLGFYSLAAVRMVGATGHVYAFEPDRPTFDLLSLSVALNGFTNITLADLALSDHDGNAVFYRSRDATAHSLVETNDHRFEECSTARVTTLDGWVMQAAIDVERIRLIKIDVEGEESRTIAGMYATLLQAGLPDLWVEVRGRRSRRAPNTVEQVTEQLKSLGYTAWFWSNGKLRPANSADVVGRVDILFRASSRALTKAASLSSLAS